ncbi:sensor histidine kinase [Micromonospora vinacea]|uniref:histidine kinase n=1 Tax=Micromonospora vinacea TaxID=709878 RepID=A0ABS0KB07_9ACTN|nr:sensor histidine kinase [Micromonospora vinacea]MBG6105824.1 signal transduction histidine kinase [Micromonospora vinacea]WSZ78015.1 sensor histidine kinase [Micromonospora sp. NBC_00860]WTA65553.1 sensor histidine kinase [Micromonospora sp. NBC_00855]
MSTQGWLVDRQARLRAFDRLRPWVMDTLVAIPIVLFSIPNIIENPLSATIATLALLPPLYWRRRYPFPAFLVTALIELIQGLLDVGVGAGVILLVMLFGVASRGSWRALAWATVITIALLVAEIYLLNPVTENRIITLFLVLGTSGAAVASGVAVRTRRAYLIALEDRAARLEVERDQRARLAVAEERARVAREMHDIVGHHVSVIVGLADGGAALATARAEQTAEPLRLIGDTGRQALSELRRVLGVLREEDADPQLSPQPGIDDLDRLLPSVRATGLPVTYSTSGELHTLGRGVQLAVYRIVQEALTNTLKHAGRGAAADVTLAVADGEVRVQVRDNGRGGPAHPSHGLLGMRERAAMYGGEVTAGPAERGWLVDVVLKEPS